MSDHEQNKINLQELSNSDYQIVGDEPNIIGWEVKNERNDHVGTVSELLFDPSSQAVRYIIVSLKPIGIPNEETRVAVPIGLATLHEQHDEVIFPDIHTEQFRAWPKYNKESFNQEIEVLIRDIIGSPAALRMEHTVAAFDKQTFYNHHNFDRAMFRRTKTYETDHTKSLDSKINGEFNEPNQDSDSEYGREKN